MGEFQHGSEQDVSADAERRKYADLLETLRGVREIGEMLLAGNTREEILARYGGPEGLSEYIGEEALDEIENAL